MQGFSLLELLVVVGVILVITAFTVPVVNRAVSVYRVGDVATQVNSSIKMARLEAIRRDAQVNWQILKSGNTTTVFGDINQSGVVNANERASIFNGSANVITAGGVPNTTGLAAAIGVAALTPIPPANGSVTFDGRGAVTGVPSAYAVYVSDNGAGGAAATYRAIILLPSGLTQVWMAASDGVWRQVN